MFVGPSHLTEQRKLGMHDRDQAVADSAEPEFPNGRYPLVPRWGACPDHEWRAALGPGELSQLGECLLSEALSLLREPSQVFDLLLPLPCAHLLRDDHAHGRASTERLHEHGIIHPHCSAQNSRSPCQRDALAR
jgi:hypothetical protein